MNNHSYIEKSQSEEKSLLKEEIKDLLNGPRANSFKSNPIIKKKLSFFLSTNANNKKKNPKNKNK